MGSANREAKTLEIKIMFTQDNTAGYTDAQLAASFRRQNKTSAPPAPHTCGGPIFGKKTPGCPRCDELLAGAAPVRRPISNDTQRVAEIRAHDCRLSKCGPVCTFGQW